MGGGEIKSENSLFCVSALLQLLSQADFIKDPFSVYFLSQGAFLRK